MGESIQRQWFQAANATVGVVVLLGTSYLHRIGAMTPKRYRRILLTSLIRSVPLGMYYLHNRRFYES